MRQFPHALVDRRGADESHADDALLQGTRRTPAPLARRLSFEVDGALAALGVEAETPRKRGRGAAGALEERVVSARSVCTAAVDKRAWELAQPALQEYMAEKIDEATLKQRKAEAREKATAEHAQLTELERASAEYTEAVSALEAAEEKLEAVLRGLERGQPGPSGVKAE